MRIGKIEVKRRVWFGLAFLFGVTAAWWIWTRAKPPGFSSARAMPPPFVRLAGAGTGTTDQVLRERAELFDPTPLFFPTEWNYGQRPLPATIRRQPGQVFGSFEAKLNFPEQYAKPYGSEASEAPVRLSDVLEQGNEVPFAGFGEVDVHRPNLPERSAYLEIRRLSDSEPLMTQSLKGFVSPKLDFAPLEFLVLVSSAGVVGEPVVASGSGWEEVDNFFRAYIVKTFRLGERLRPGRYRVIVGP